MADERIVDIRITSPNAAQVQLRYKTEHDDGTGKVEWLALMYPFGEKVTISMVYREPYGFPDKRLAFASDDFVVSSYVRVNDWRASDANTMAFELNFYSGGEGAAVWTPRWPPDAHDPLETRGEIAPGTRIIDADIQVFYPLISKVTVFDPIYRPVHLRLRDIDGWTVWASNDTSDYFLQPTPDARVRRGALYTFEMSTQDVALVQEAGQDIVDEDGNFRRRFHPMDTVDVNASPVPGLFTYGPTNRGDTIGPATVLFDRRGRFSWTLAIDPQAPVGRHPVTLAIAGVYMGLVLQVTDAASTLA